MNHWNSSLSEKQWGFSEFLYPQSDYNTLTVASKRETIVSSFLHKFGLGMISETTLIVTGEEVIVSYAFSLSRLVSHIQ